MSDIELEKCIENSKLLNVLFVEDNKEFANQTIKLFHNFFKSVTLALNANDGITKFKTNQYDLVISDINMPNMNGISMIQQLKNINHTIPIIMLTAHDDSKLILKCIEIGIDGYLLKPIQLNELLVILKKITQQFTYKKVVTKINLNNNFTWIPNTSQLLYFDTVVKLTANETKFLSNLIMTEGSIISHEALDELVFDRDGYDHKRIINLMTRLRKKIGNDLIESVYGEGYRIKIDYTH